MIYRFEEVPSSDDGSDDSSNHSSIFFFLQTMTYTNSTLLAIATLFVAVVLNTLSYSLPLWATSHVVNESLTNNVIKAEFLTGVWGYCTDVELNHFNSSAAFHQCYGFRYSNDYTTSSAEQVLFKNFSSGSICDGYSKAKGLGDVAHKAFTVALATGAGMDPDQFDQFLGKTCGWTGYFTELLTNCSVGVGGLAFLCLVLAVTYYKNNSCVNNSINSGLFNACLFSGLTWILWIVQAHPLGKKDPVHYGISFVLNILSWMLYLVTSFLLKRDDVRKDGYDPIA